MSIAQSLRKSVHSNNNIEKRIHTDALLPILATKKRYLKENAERLRIISSASNIPLHLQLSAAFRSIRLAVVIIRNIFVFTMNEALNYTVNRTTLR